MPDYSEEEFQAQLCFVEAAAPNPPAVAPYGEVGGGVGAGVPATALGGRTYRVTIQRDNPLIAPGGPPRIGAPVVKAPVRLGAPGGAGFYYLITDYDVAMADLDYSLVVVGVAAALRSGDLFRIGSLTDASGRVRGVYELRLALVSSGAIGDLPGSLVNLTMKRVNPNQKNPAVS